MSNQIGKKPTPEQLEEMRQAQAQAQDTFINQNTALPMPQEGNKIPLEGGGYTWIDPKLANKPIPEAPEGRELTMDDMLTDQKTFEYFKKKGAFDSDQPWYEMLYEGGKAMVSDSYDWMNSLGWRLGSNLLIFDWFGDGPLAQASKNIKASARATTLQTIGDIGLNYEQLGQGASRLIDKLVMKEGSHEDNKSSYEFWKGINEIEKRRQTAAAELASSDFLMMGGDPEIRRMIREGEAKPDYKASMGASIWADPLNYISIGAGYKALRGGANTAFNGAESAMLKELQEAYAFQAQLKEVAKVNPSKKVSDTIDVMDGFIGENLDKLNKIAPKRDIALRQLAESLPQGHQLREQIEQALTGIPLKAKSNITSKLTGGGMIATGKAVEITGSILNLASRLPQETAINLLMRLGVKEQTAMQIAQSSAVQLGMGGTATYGLASTLTDDELLQLSAVTAVIAPQLLRTYGRDFAKMGAELMQPETILPYWKRLASRGSETLTERTIDRTQWFPVASVAEQITGAGQGKVGQRIASPFTKNPNNKLGIGLKNEPLGSTGSGGLYDLANALDKSKAGRYLELGGRMTDATAKGGAIGGVFGYVAGGGEQDEALYGGIGAGGLLGLGGGGIGGYGRFRGNLSPTDLIQARYGTHQYYTKNLLPAMQKDKFNSLRKDVQIAVATTAMSYPNLQIEYYNGGKSGVGGEQGINKEGVPYIKVNVDSPRAIEPVIKHELSHYIEEIGGTTPFNDMLIGNPILGLKGFFTKLDDNGDPIKKRDGSYETTQKFEDLKFDYFSKFDEYEALYLQSVKSAKAHGATEKNARDYAKRRVLQKVNKLKDNRTGAFIADQQTVRELVAEHGVDFFLNDHRRYRDLREGWVGALMRNIVDMPMLNNRQFLRTTLGKLGATFRADGTLTTPNSLFRETQRIPMVTELIRKYNRQMEGLSAEQMQKKFPVSEAEVVPVDISGADLAKNPELIELIRAGTFLKVDEDGVIRSNKAMTPAEIKRYNKEFSESILEEVNKIDADEGLPEGHIKETKNEKTGEISFAGRFIDERVIDRLEQKGGWNKAQIDLLRSLNRTLRYNKNETGGTDWLMSYFKATKKGKYVNAKVEHQVHIPYGIEITQKGNILIRTISQKQLDRNINKAFRQHKAEITRLYGADLDKAIDNFHADMHLWSRNHAEGKKGKDGLDPDPQIAEAKANFINSMFGKSSKAHVDANPWLEQVDGGKKSPTPTYRSLRLERIGKANQLTGKIHIDHNKIAKNLMPKPVDMDALLAQNPQMRSTDPNYIPAYHGSRYNFDKFSTDRIGTGEGAQAFGYGLYFAGSKDVAEYYRDKLSGYKSRFEFTPEVKQKYEPLIEAETSKNEKVIQELSEIGGKRLRMQSTMRKINDDLIRYEQQYTKESDAGVLQVVTEKLQKKKKEYKKAYNALGKRMDLLYEKRGALEKKIGSLIDEMQSKGTLVKDGKMYEVDLKPKDEEFLVWDKPMSKQSDIVKDVHNQILKGKTETLFTTPMDTFETGVMNSQFTFRLQQMRYPDDGASFYQLLSRAMNGDDKASRALKFEGIRGIKYLDGSSRSKGEGNYNYVIFDDADVEITKKYMPSMSRRGMLKAMLGGTLASMVKGGDVIVPKKIGTGGIKFPIYGKEHLDTLIEDLGGLEQNHYDDNTVGSPAHEDVSRVLSVFEEIRDSGKIPEFVDDFSKSEAMELMTAYENVYEWSDHPDRSKWEPPHEKIYDKILEQQKPQELTMEQALESAEGGTVGDLVNNPFKGASDDIPKIIEDINIATNIFQNAPALYPFERSWHINTLVKRIISNADTSLIGKRIENAKKHNNSKRLEFNQNRLNKADEYFYYMKYPLQDLVASLPDIKSQDLKQGLNSARNADPFEPIKDNFQGGSKRPLQDILQEMANVHDKFYPESKSTLNEIRGIGEILKDDYGAEIKEEFLDELYRRYRNLTKEEHEQFKAEEQKTLKELFNPEFNDIQDLGGGTKFIKPIDPDKNFMPSAERKPVTFSARPEEIVTLDSENIKNFMPAHKNVRLEDYLDYPIFCLPSDRMGVGTMFVGPEGQKIPIDFDAQGGRGFMYLYENGGWAFSNQDSSSRFLSRVKEIAGGRDHALVGITIMSDINHLNSVFGQLSLAQAYEAVIRSGHVSKEQMRDHLQDVMGRVAGQKYTKDVLSRDKKSIKHKAGTYKLSEDVRKALLSIEDPSTYKQALLDRKINFGVSPVIVEKFQQVGAKIKPDDQKKYNIDVHSVARDVADPELIGQPVGQVVALLKVPVDQKPKKVDFHLSYPWQVKGEAIGFLDQFKALEDLTSEKRVYRPDGTIRYGQPVQSVLPAFDKLNPALYMPNYKPMIDAKADNIRGLVMPKIKQDKFSPQQFQAKLSEVKGAKEMAEDIGLLDYLEGKKSVTKDEIDQYISNNRKSIMLRMENGNGMYENSQMESGLRYGYNEILFYLPTSSKYPHPDVSGGHWQNDRILMHMRTTERMLDDGSNRDEGYPMSFHIEEMQSDWHQYGRGEGYVDGSYAKETAKLQNQSAELWKEISELDDKAYEKRGVEMRKLFDDEFYKNFLDLLAERVDMEDRQKTKAETNIYAKEGDKLIREFKKLSKNPTRENQYAMDEVIFDLSHAFEKQKSDAESIFLLTDRKDRMKLVEESNANLKKVREFKRGYADFRDKTHDVVQKSNKKKKDEWSAIEKKLEDMSLSDLRSNKQNPAPFKNSWQHRAFADAVQMAVNQGHKYLTWTTGKRSAEMANLDNTFKSVEVRYTAEKYLNPDGSNKYSINAVGKDQFGGNTIRKSLSEEELKNTIGKDYAKEAITRLEKSDKPITENKVELTNIVVPHKGRRLLYDSILPSVAKRIAKTLGTRPPTKANIITQEWGVVPQKVGDKARHKTQEVWLMELPTEKEKLHELPLYMPSLMPQQNIPQANTNIMNRLQTGYFLSPKMRIGASKASQARDLEPENSYFKN